MLVLPYSTLMNCSMVQMLSVGGFSGKEFIFTKYQVTAGKLTIRFPRLRRKDVLLHPVSEWQGKTIWFHTNDSQRLLPILQFTHSQLLHYRYDQNYYFSIYSATAYFLVRPFSYFRRMSNYSCICLLMQTKAYRKLDTLRLSFPRKVQGSL